MDFKKLRIKMTYWSINSLKAYPLNAKSHPEKQIQEIVNSIKAFGMNDPIGVDENTKTIIEGHGRLIACKKLGYKKVPIVKLGHLNPTQQNLYRIAHNKINMNSPLDIDILTSELSMILDEHGIDADHIMDVTGIDDAEFQEMFEVELDEENENPFEFDNMPDTFTEEDEEDEPEQKKKEPDNPYYTLEIPFKKKQLLQLFLQFLQYDGDLNVHSNKKLIMPEYIQNGHWLEKKNE